MVENDQESQLKAIGWSKPTRGMWMMLFHRPCWNPWSCQSIFLHLSSLRFAVKEWNRRTNHLPQLRRFTQFGNLHIQPPDSPQNHTKQVPDGGKPKLPACTSSAEPGPSATRGTGAQQATALGWKGSACKAKSCATWEENW